MSSKGLGRGARRNLSTAERTVAFVLSLAWLAGGCVGVYFGAVLFHWGLIVFGVLAIAYGVAWVRVALRSRLLTWRELVAPWRSEE